MHLALGRAGLGLALPSCSGSLPLAVPWKFCSHYYYFVTQILFPNPTFLPSLCLCGAGLRACPVTEGEESNSELHLSNFCSLWLFRSLMQFWLL